eukprot:Lithocolla_globosa_v1_NODE_22_length_9343_cov_54.984819.p11 type:complete len:113 gc:universal NODE_22_length_9343_cov_54.984819:35-373(+)
MWRRQNKIRKSDFRSDFCLYHQGSEDEADEAFGLATSFARCFRLYTAFRDWTPTEIRTFKNTLTVDYAVRREKIFPGSMPTKCHMLTVEMPKMAECGKQFFLPLCHCARFSL